MRILMVHDTLAGRGGAERYIREVAEALAAQGHRLAFLTAPGQSPAWLRTPPYRLGPAQGVRSTRRALPELESVLEAAAPELLYLHNLRDFGWTWLLPVMLARMRRRAPCVIFVHDVRPLCPNEAKIRRAARQPCHDPAGRACLRCDCGRMEGERRPAAWARLARIRWGLQAYRRADGLVAPSGYIAAELARNGVAPDRIAVLPYFIRRRPDGSPLAGADTDILWVGRFGADRIKGFEAFLEMLERLRDLPWRAAAAGDGELLAQARARVDALGLGSRVAFPGHLTDAELDRWYGRSRIVVVTSRVSESFCMVGPEAMAHGRPTVAFDAGGIPEWCADGVTGLRVPYGDTHALAAAVRRLLADPDLCRRLGERGRAAVEARYRPAAHLAGLLPAFEAARGRWAGSRGARALGPQPGPQGSRA